MRCAFMNRRLKILPLTVSVLLCVNTHSAFSFDNLRPASILNAQGSADDIAFLTGRNNRASASGMMIESGLCNSLPKVARGKAAFVSTYSAYDIMRNLNRQYKKEATFAERIDREKTVVLPQLIEELAEAVKNAGHAQAAILLQGENGYRDKVERYLEERKQAIVDNGQLIRNSIGALEFFLAIDLRKAKAGHDEVKTEQLRLLLGETQKKALADMDRTPDSLLTDKQADLLWDEYEAARETVAVQYKTQAESYKRMQNEIEVKMRALSRRNRMLLNYALQAHEQGDTEEAHALQDTVRANISLLKQCEKARLTLSGLTFLRKP